jgi:RecJ-like exonuclease
MKKFTEDFSRWLTSKAENEIIRSLSEAIEHMHVIEGKVVELEDYKWQFEQTEGAISDLLLRLGQNDEHLKFIARQVEKCGEIVKMQERSFAFLLAQACIAYAVQGKVDEAQIHLQKAQLYAGLSGEISGFMADAINAVVDLLNIDSL